jgi:hypothetical protein
MFLLSIGQYLLLSSSFVNTRGTLLLLLFLGSVAEMSKYGFNILSTHCLREASPSWTQEKNVHPINTRRNRKHGRFKITPRYPNLRRIHIVAFLHHMIHSHSDRYIDHRVATAFRHIPWASTDTIPPFSLEYFDVSFTIPRNYKFTTIEWDSTSSPTFSLPTISTEGLFAADEDPSDIMHLVNFDVHSTNLDFGTTNDTLTVADMPLYFSLLDNASCYSTSPVDPPLIVDTGASVCITPLQSDFETYRPSTMKIKDLSSLNKVVGDGIISWHIVTNEKNQVTLKLPGFHIPTAVVRLLSPQLLLHQAGGYTHQISTTQFGSSIVCLPLTMDSVQTHSGHAPAILVTIFVVLIRLVVPSLSLTPPFRTVIKFQSGTHVLSVVCSLVSLPHTHHLYLSSSTS